MPLKNVKDCNQYRDLRNRNAMQLQMSWVLGMSWSTRKMDGSLHHLQNLRTFPMWCMLRKVLGSQERCSYSAWTQKAAASIIGKLNCTWLQLPGAKLIANESNSIEFWTCLWGPKKLKTNAKQKSGFSDNAMSLQIESANRSRVCSSSLRCTCCSLKRGVLRFTATSAKMLTVHNARIADFPSPG